jgi:hypothetical protein
MLSSNFKYYNLQKRKEENKLRKLTTEVEQAEEYVKKVQDIYGGDSRNSMQTSKKEKSENEEKSRSTNQKLAEKNNQDDNFNNRKIFEFSISKYIVEFNSERYDEKINKGVEVDFNNTIKVTSPIKVSQVEEEQNEKDKESANENEQEQEQVEQENENEQEQVEQEEHEQIDQNENELVEQNENELVEQNENIETNQNNKRFEDLLYSNKTSLNIDENTIPKENEYVDENNINLGEYNQGENINSELLQGYGDITHDEQNYSYVKKPLVNESTNKVLVQETTLPLKYLPEKVNKVIVDTNVGTLPLIIGRKTVTYSSGYDNMNNLMGISQASQYNPVSLSYQIPNNTNYQYSM